MIVLFKLLLLLAEFIYVGLLSFGGGYATIPLIEERIISYHHWIDMGQFVDMITISQMTPGPLTVNISTFVGYTFMNVKGALIATIGSALPGVILTLLMIRLYEKYHSSKLWQTIIKSLRISAAALIAIATVHIFTLVFNISLSSSLFELGFTVLLLLVTLKFDFDPLLVLLISGLFGLFFLS